MKRIVFSLLFLILICLPALATPDKAVWIRTVFLGVGGGHYYCLVVERDQPGLHDTYTENTFFIEFNPDGKIEEKKRIRSVLHHDKGYLDGGEREWTKTVESSPVNIDKILAEKGVEYSFPATEMPGQYHLKPTGIYVTKDKKEVLQIGAEDIKAIADQFDKYGRAFPADLKGVELAAYYDGYLLLQYGSTCCYDSSFMQIVVPVMGMEKESGDR